MPPKKKGGKKNQDFDSDTEMPVAKAKEPEKPKKGKGNLDNVDRDAISESSTKGKNKKIEGMNNSFVICEIVISLQICIK